jgi:Immunoglobulin I-set domain
VYVQGTETVQLLSNDRVTVDNDAGTVKFTELIKSDEGQYTCKALNDVGEDTAVGQLHVLGKLTPLMNGT